MRKKIMTHTMGLKILFGPKYWLWSFDESKLSFVTPYILSKQISKFAYFLYSQIFQISKSDNILFLWDMFGGIGTDTVYLSQYFNIITTENDPQVFEILSKNIREFRLNNVNLIMDNCLSGLGKIRPDIIYYDPPWGESYKSKIKNFDFNQVYIDFPPIKNDPVPQLIKRVSCIDLVKYLYEHVSKNIIIKSPLNSNSFERVFPDSIQHIYKYPNKNLKFIFLVDQVIEY